MEKQIVSGSNTFCERGFANADFFLVIGLLIYVPWYFVLPAFYDYQLRYDVRTLVDAHLTPAKESVAETFARKGRMPDEDELAELRKSYTTISIRKNCELLLTLADKDVNSIIRGLTIRMVPSVNDKVLSWRCIAAGEGPGIDDYVPGYCDFEGVGQKIGSGYRIWGGIVLALCIWLLIIFDESNSLTMTFAVATGFTGIILAPMIWLTPGWPSKICSAMLGLPCLILLNSCWFGFMDRKSKELNGAKSDLKDG